MKKKWILPLVPAAALTAVVPALVACQEEKLTISIYGGGRLVQGIEGQGGQDLSKWRLIVNRATVPANFYLEPEEGTDLTYIDIEDGLVSWSDEITRGEYYFKVAASYKNEVHYSETICLAIYSAEEPTVIGGSTHLNGYINQPEKKDTKAWYMSVPEYKATLSLVSTTEEALPTTIYIDENGYVTWKNVTTSGVYSFKVSAQHDDDEPILSDEITLVINDFQFTSTGSLELHGLNNAPGQDTETWAASSGTETGTLKVKEYDPDTKEVTDNDKIYISKGHVSWNEGLENKFYYLKVFATTKDGEKEIESDVITLNIGLRLAQVHIDDQWIDINSFFTTHICDVDGTANIIIDGKEYSREAFNYEIKILPGPINLPDGFLKGCKYYNNNIDFSQCTSLTGIGNGFLQNCLVYNQTLTLPNTLRTIGDDFMSGTMGNSKKVDLPLSVQEIGANFLSGAKYNYEFSFSRNMHKIGDNFMMDNVVFNKPITFDSSTAYLSIGSNFLNGASSFSSTVSLPTRLKSIGHNFLANCPKFNSPIAIPSNVTYIGQYFLANCTDFNSTVTFASTINSTTIDSCFMYNCQAFNHDITFPNGIKSISPDHFLWNLYAMSSRTLNFKNLKVDVFTDADATNALAFDSNKVQGYKTGYTIDGTNKSDIVGKFPNHTKKPYRKVKAKE